MQSFLFIPIKLFPIFLLLILGNIADGFSSYVLAIIIAFLANCLALLLGTRLRRITGSVKVFGDPFRRW